MIIWDDTILGAEKPLLFIEQLALLLRASPCHEGFCGYDFNKRDIDNNLDKIVAYIKDIDDVEANKSLGSLLIHHGSNMPDFLKSRILKKVKLSNPQNFHQKLNLKRFVRDLESYQINHPIPQEKIY